MALKIEEIKQQLDAFRESDAARMTVKELLTTTSNIALPTMVQARAVLQMLAKNDLREQCNRITVPKGSGKVAYIQHLTAPGYDSWTPGSALSAADPTVASVYVTLAEFGKVTQIEDLLANTSAINFVEEVGRVHGDCVIQGIADKVIDATAAATGNAVSIGTKADSTEASFTFTNVASAIGNIVADGFTPDYAILPPDKGWTCFTTDYSITQFTGALADFMATGKIPKVMGLDWIAEPYFETAVGTLNGTDGEKYMYVGTKGKSTGWGELQANPNVQLYYVPTELCSYVVTNLSGGGCKLIDNATAVIKHAA